MSTEVKLPLNEISAVCLRIQNDPTKLSCGLSLVTAVVHLQQEKIAATLTREAAKLSWASWPFPKLLGCL